MDQILDGILSNKEGNETARAYFIVLTAYRFTFFFKSSGILDRSLRFPKGTMILC